MRRRHGIGACGAAGLAVALLAAGVAQAQGTPAPTSLTIPNQYPPALPQRKGPEPPRLTLEVRREVPLPGPLGDGPLVVVGDAVRVPLAAGSALAPFISGDPRLVPAPAPGAAPAPDPWTYHPNGRLRYRGEEGGFLEAEERGPWPRSGWHRAWTLRLPSGVAAPPVVVGRRLCLTAQDDQVYCLRADNGHRLWAADLGERVSRAPVVWSTSIPSDARRRGSALTTLDVLLVVPDSGGSIVGLDAYDGRRLTAFELPPGAAFASAPVVLSDDRIALARRGYDPADAALMVLQIEAPDAHPGPDGAPVSYNGPDAGSPKVPGR